MGSVKLQPVERWWHCPSCALVDRTERADVHTQMHACPALGGIVIPLCRVSGPDANPDARHVLVLREDYVGRSGASPVAAIRTERADGSNDCTVLAPAAQSGVAAYI